MGLMMKMFYEVATLLIWSEQSIFWPAIQYLTVFWVNGGFQNIGMAFGLLLRTGLNYDIPAVFVPLDPFFTVQDIMEAVKL